MSTLIEDRKRHQTLDSKKGKAALAMEVIQGKTTVAEGGRCFDIAPVGNRSLGGRCQARYGKRPARQAS